MRWEGTWMRPHRYCSSRLGGTVTQTSLRYVQPAYAETSYGGLTFDYHSLRNLLDLSKIRESDVVCGAHIVHDWMCVFLE